MTLLLYFRRRNTSKFFVPTIQRIQLLGAGYGLGKAWQGLARGGKNALSWLPLAFWRWHGRLWIVAWADCQTGHSGDSGGVGMG